MIGRHLFARFLGRLLVGAVLAVAVAPPLAAQANILARMTVLEPVVTGAGVRPVEFGTVTPGTPVAITIATAADSAATGVALFSFTGITGRRDTQLSFTWGANLVNSASGMTIPFSMNGSYGMHCFDRKTQPPVCTLFNPGQAGGTTGTVVATPPAPPGGNTGTLRVYLGGGLNPPVGLAPGLYTMTIAVTLTRI